jgi:hypothetical protein
MFKERSVKRPHRNILRLVTISFCLILLSIHTAYAAAPLLLVVYRTDSVIAADEGKAYYGDLRTRFSGVDLDVNSDSSKRKGTLEIKDAAYTFRTERANFNEGTEVIGGNHIFDLTYIGKIDNGKTSVYFPTDGGNKESLSFHDRYYDRVIFYGAAETELSEKTVSWTLGKDSGDVALPKIRSTREQLDSYVPYVEYILTDEKVTGVILRMVKPDEPEKAILKAGGTGFKEFYRVELWVNGSRENYYQELKFDKKFNPGDAIEVELNVDPPLLPSRIGTVFIWFKDEAQTDGADVKQKWSFHRRSKNL